LFCIGNAPNETLFLRLVKNFLRYQGLVGFIILSCSESPVGSLPKKMERECLQMEQEVIEFSQEDEAEYVHYLSVPAILRYVA
jgi:hypothetical protein